MFNNKYAKAYSEVLTILKYIPTEDYYKIPKSKIELFEANSDKNYTFNYDPSKTLGEQKVSNITKGIIILLFRDYWANEAQRSKIIEKQNYDRKKSEDKKQEKYNSIKNFINNNRKPLLDIKKNNQEILLVKIKDIKWYKKFWNVIKNLIRKQ